MTTTARSNTYRGAARAIAVALCAAMFACAQTELLNAQQVRSTPRPARDTVRAEDGHPLIVWSKRPRDHVVGSILLLHGRTWSSLPNFDLRVRDESVSLMDVLVARGYAVYALDQRGYGATARDNSQWLTPTRAARDAVAALEWIAARQPDRSRPALLGYSQGGLTAMLAAQRSGVSMSALVLYGFPLDVSGTQTFEPNAAKPERRRTTVAAAEEDFITPESTPSGVKEAYGKAAVAADPIRADWRDEAEFRALDPAALKVPVLVINGEHDPYSSEARIPAFMARLRGSDRDWVVLAKTDHAAHLERQTTFVQALTSFLARVSTTGQR